MPKGDKLTAKQAKFIDEYLIDLNATQAAIRAGYSKKTAQAIGTENLQKPLIAEALSEKREKLSQKTEITIERVLEEYAKLGFLDPRAFYDEDGSLIPVQDLPADVAAALTGMDVSVVASKDGDELETVKKFKFADKKTALDSIAKHLGMFIDKIEHGLDADTVEKILAEFPKDYAEAVRAALAALASLKK